MVKEASGSAGRGGAMASTRWVKTGVILQSSVQLEILKLLESCFQMLMGDS